MQKQQRGKTFANRCNSRYERMDEMILMEFLNWAGGRMLGYINDRQRLILALLFLLGSAAVFSILVSPMWYDTLQEGSMWPREKYEELYPLSVVHYFVMGTVWVVVVVLATSIVLATMECIRNVKNAFLKERRTQ